MATSGGNSTLPKIIAYRQKLAIDIISEEFGDITRDVAHILCGLDYCPLPLLLKACQSCLVGPHKLTIKQIKQALLVLLRHSLLIVEIPHDAEVDDNNLFAKLQIPNLLYKLNVDAILHRLKHPRLLRYVSEKYGEVGVEVMTEIIVRGQASLDSLTGSPSPSSQISTYPTEDVAAVLQELVKDRLLLQAEARSSNSNNNSIFQRDAYLKRHDVTVYEKHTPASRGGLKKSLALLPAPTPSTAAQNSAAAGSKKRLLVMQQAEARGASPLPVEMQFFAGVSTSANPNPSTSTSKYGEEAEWRDDGDGGDGPPASKVARSEGLAAGRGGRGGRGRGRGRGATGRGVVIKEEGTSAAAASASPSAAEAPASAPSSALFSPSIQWSVNYEHVLRIFHTELFVAEIRNRHERYASDILSAALELSPLPTYPLPSASSPISLAEVFRLLSARYASASASASASAGGQVGGVDMKKYHTPAQFEQTVEILRHSPMHLPPILKLSPLAPAAASLSAPLLPATLENARMAISYGNLVALSRKEVVRTVCVQKHGVYAARVLECLQRHKYLEQSALSEHCILPPRETREIVYTLYREGLIDYVELSKRGDFNPTNNFYFWFCDPDKMYAKVLSYIYQTLFNIRARRAYELQKHQDLIDIVQSSIQSNTTLSAVEQEKYTILRGRLEALDRAMHQVEDTVFLFERY